jgi:hypothetical protein
MLSLKKLFKKRKDKAEARQSSSSTQSSRSPTASAPIQPSTKASTSPATSTYQPDAQEPQLREWRFSYRKLEDARSWIRLLKVNEYQPNMRVRFYCTIAHYSLKDSFIYFNALSYTWGSPFATARCKELYDVEHSGIFIHIRDADAESKDGYDGFIEITRNLADALKFWFENAEYKENLIWIDQLSIDQNDVPERQLQVTRMGEIYAGSRETVAWLGFIHQDWEDMFDTMHKLCMTISLYEKMNDGIIEPQEITSIDDFIAIPKINYRIHHNYCARFFDFLRNCRYLGRV